MTLHLSRFCESYAFFSRGLRALRLVLLVLLLLMTSVLSNVARAQSSPESQVRVWDLSLWAAAATGEENTNSFSEAQILTAGIFVGHALTREAGTGWRSGHLEYAADFIPVFVQFSPHKVRGTAFDPIILRWHSSVRGGHISPVVELGGGGLHTSGNFPQGNTSTFNFIARVGGGILINTKHWQALEIACRWWHISNANLGTQNPEFNGIQLSLGWHWFK